MLTDGQFATLLAALVAGGGATLGAIRWAVGRIVKALDDNSEERAKASAEAIKLAAKLEAIHDWMIDRRQSAPTPVEGVPVTGRYSLHARPGTKGDR